MGAKHWQQRDFAEQLGVSGYRQQPFKTRQSAPVQFIKMANTLGLELTLKSAKIKE